MTLPAGHRSTSIQSAVLGPSPAGTGLVAPTTLEAQTALGPPHWQAGCPCSVLRQSSPWRPLLQPQEQGGGHPSHSLCACVTPGAPSVGTGLGASSTMAGEGWGQCRSASSCLSLRLGLVIGREAGSPGPGTAGHGRPGYPLGLGSGVSTGGQLPRSPSHPLPGPTALMSRTPFLPLGLWPAPHHSGGDRRDSKNRRSAWPCQGSCVGFFLNSNFFDKIFSHGGRHWGRPVGSHS